MKKTLLVLMSLAAMLVAGMSLRAQEVTIQLFPGWNQIAYPYPETTDLETVFGDFEPMSGDVVECLFEYSEYITGEGWIGDVEEFKPGWGYSYYSNRTETVSVVLGVPVSQFIVTTAVPTNVTEMSAVLGGTVNVPADSHVFLKGICWGTEHNPDIDGNHTSENTSIGSFSGMLEDLNPNTTYYVRAYMVSDAGLAYGNEMSFTTENSNGHSYVDLGLPSGLLWATCNVGASVPEEFGDYFAWGETQSKSIYNWSTYQYCRGYYNTITKYCNNSNYGYNGFTDNLTTLLSGDDAATANWGGGARTPTKEEWQELYNNCTSIWTTKNGVNGRRFIGPNGNSIFLPAVGCRLGSSLIYVGSEGYYWSSSIDTTHPNDAWLLFFISGNCVSYIDRYYGLSVRPVRSAHHK